MLNLILRLKTEALGTILRLALPLSNVTPYDLIKFLKLFRPEDRIDI